MLLAAAFVSYAGPFTSKFRAGLIKEWIKFLMDKGAPMTPGISDPLKVGSTSESMTPARQASLPRALLVAMPQWDHDVDGGGGECSMCSEISVGIVESSPGMRNTCCGPAGPGG